MNKTGKNELKDIKPGYGLGILKFGMTRNEVDELLGNPNEIEKHEYSDSETELTEAWHYDDLELSLEFDEQEDWKLTTISVSSEFYKFKEKQLIGIDQNKLLLLLKELDIDDFEVEDLSPIENPSHKLISIYDLGINFWFENEVLMEVQWCPLFNEDDSINWPE